MIYLDNASSHILLDEIKKNIVSYLDYCYNPSAKYSVAQKTEYEIQKTRKIIADILKISENNVIFTSGGTEANNLAVMGYKLRRESRFSVAYLGFEHTSVLKSVAYLKKQGHGVFGIDYFDLISDIDKVIERLDENNVNLLILSHVYSNIAILLPLKDIVNKIKKAFPKIYIHIDAAQSFMKEELDMSGIDSLSVSAHKIGALKGVGALILRDKQNIAPLIRGGKQNFSLRSGTENVAGILSFKDALDVWNKNNKEFRDAIKSLNLYFRERFLELFENDASVKIITPDKNYSNSIVTMAVKNVLSEHVIRYLDENSIMISAASNCDNLNFTPEFSKILNLDKSYYNGIIRVSFSAFNKKEEIDIFFDKLKEALDYFVF